jgi:hypothetical protein
MSLYIAFFRLLLLGTRRLNAMDFIARLDEDTFQISSLFFFHLYGLRSFIPPRQELKQRMVYEAIDYTYGVCIERNPTALWIVGDRSDSERSIPRMKS